MMKRASVSDVAKLAGVSTATVSRVTTAPERVAEATRNKVLDAIKDLDYIKSASGQSLRQQSSQNVLVIVNNIGNIYWSEIFHGIHHRAEQNGYSVMISTPDPGGKHGTYIEQLRTGRVDGVILLDPIEISSADKARINQHFHGMPPIVAFTERLEKIDLPRVFINNELAAYRATSYLIECGHKRIAHIHGPETQVAAGERIKGYERAMKEHGLAIGRDDLWLSEFHRDGGRRVARRIARLNELPSAIFCCTDEVAMGCISEFDTLGVRVPQDVSVMGFDNNSFADVYVPPLCTMAQPRERIGVAAMDLLLETIAHRSNPDAKGKSWPPVTELKVNLAKRTSVRDISAPPKR